ncbi:MAG TPA: hypothetical protein VFG68_12600 [Fimbriiglobus sp.]|nr:hypothetical protein [Fimbriiglobus sp.]
MPALTTALIRALLTSQDAPCVSIYLPTHRSYPDNQQDPIRYRNLVDAAERSLRAKYPGRDVRALLERFRALTADRAFWNHALDGLAVLGSADRFEVVKLPRTAPELGVVADSFHLKPLLRFVQSADRFHVLGLSRTEATLYEGNRYGLSPAENGLPTFAEAVGTEVTQPTREKLTTGGRSPSTGHYSGAGTRKDELDVDQEKFLRAIDRAVIEKFSKPSGLPMIVVGLDVNLGEFRKLTQNPHVVQEMISGDPGAYSPEQLRALAWKVMEPKYLARLARLTENYRTALGTGLASSDPAAIAPAAMDGRVGMLLVDADKVVPGRIDRVARTVRTDELANPEVDDVLDDLAELVLNTGGEVVVVPHDRMPTDTGAAAVYRF